MCTQTKSEFNEKPQKYSQSNTQSPYVLTNSIHIFTHTTTDLYHNGNSNNLEKWLKFANHDGGPKILSVSNMK